MRLADLKPVSSYAQRMGFKSLVYGAAGTGKTPIAATAPRPIILVCEPGMISLRNSNIPAFPSFTTTALNEFFTWLMGSKEAENFDTICIDSVSQMCEMILTEELKNNKDGRKAYGELSRKTMEKLNALYYMPQKHLYLICKEQRLDGYKRPFFPGQDLVVKIPHLFDAILHLGIHQIPNFGEQKAFRCQGNFDTMARDRSGNLAEYEQTNLTTLIRKALA